MSLKISRVLHAGYIFECAGTKILFDPISENPFSRNCFAYPSVEFDPELIRRERFDAVFISHHHDDHCSLESLDLLDRRTPIYIYCLFDEIFELVRALGFESVHSLSVNVSVLIASIEVIPRRALDSLVDSMFQIRASGLNVLNVVDSWMDPSTLEELREFAPWDMVLWPFQTMRETGVIAPSRASEQPTHLPEEWFEELGALNPRYVVPSSCQFIHEDWSWYNHALFPVAYAQFEREMSVSLASAQVVRLNPGVSVCLNRQTLSIDAPLAFVRPVGEQNLDYSFDPDVVAPPVAEIARRFRALDAVAASRVDEYCRAGLLERFRSFADMEEDFGGDSYFGAAPRLWQLSVFDHLGAETRYLYRVHGSEIELVSSGTDELVPSWTTEVAAAKIYSALEEGESLSSMYIRINDRIFDSAVEAEVSGADILEDPLIRCLFNGAFGTYQAAQLKKILARKQASND